MLTLKQFLLREAHLPSEMDESFMVGEVMFDNRRGIGSTPNNGNILYKGAVAWIKPSVFRALAVQADRGDTAKKLEAEIRRGTAIAAPFLELDIVSEDDSIQSIANPEKVRVVGHEGRARSDAFKAINGDIPMPVQLQLLGLRAHHLSPEFFKWIEANGLVAERSTEIVKPNATMYYWNGQVVEV